MGKRSLALDGDLPFGAMRLPGFVEQLRIIANRLRGDALSRRIVSVARRVCLVGRPDPIDVDVFGFCRARLYPRSNRCERRVFLGVNSWDLAEREAISERLKASTPERPFVFVDGGANVGLYSLYVASEARCLARTADIIAIEPDPVNLGRLEFNLAASAAGEIRIVPYALGDRAGSGLLLPGRNNRGEVHLAKPGESVDGGIEVPIKTLAGILDEAGIAHIDVLKLDIEGAEYAALSGLFSEAPEELWPSMIILEVGKSDRLSDACRLCLDHGYAAVRRTSLNIILRRPDEAGGLKSQMESGL